MSESQEEIIHLFFDYLSKFNHDEAKEYMERQRLEYLNKAWPKAVFAILCDFALAEMNYYDTNFEPSKNKMIERKEDENYLDFVYKTLFLDLERLQTEVDDFYVTRFMSTLLKYISVRLQLLELYDKLYEIGSLNTWINFSELSEMVEKIQNELTNLTFTPVDEILRIVRYELNCIQHLFKCHEHLGEWLYFDSLLSLKESSDAFILWEKCYDNKELWEFGSLFTNKNTLPPLLVWFKIFKHMTISKFLLYYYGILVRQSSLQKVKNMSETKNLHFFTRMQTLKQKAEALAVMLVFEISDVATTTTDNDSSDENPTKYTMDANYKYKTIICYPQIPVKLEIVEKIKSNEENSMDKIVVITEENMTYMLMRVDLKITFIMCFDEKPKNEEREKASTLEFVSMLRCHKYFTSINR